ncbi:CLUMA_CG000401, isoform A [Clunio marinus]|uniref:CLUMA_CG000401, isoform A n=1 Tax=Clunio marinus TaxID=568069 RepID=A0A1J1HEN8_9DIPT|nr:CLUMA_CG000401, isoform A [Clunio marinus]
MNKCMIFYELKGGKKRVTCKRIEKLCNKKENENKCHQIHSFRSVIDKRVLESFIEEQEEVLYAGFLRGGNN